MQSSGLFGYCFSSKALLGQPGSFQGFLSGRVLPSPGDLAVAYRDDYRVANIDLSVASLHSADTAQQGEHFVTRLGQLLDLDPARIERLLPLP